MPDQPGQQPHRIAISADRNGRGYIEIDGHDIAHVVRDIDISIAAGHWTAVALDLAGALHARVDGRVVIDQPTQDALIALGWTPPAEP